MTSPSAHDDLVEVVIAGRAREVGTFTVTRLLPSPHRRMVGPFVFLNHMGPIAVAPGVGFDVLPHPHIGLSTVTYLLAGENIHRDSLGTVQRNVPGDINLMTAGRGVVHSERADPAWRAHGGELHGVQLWLALPAAREDDAPSFEHHPAATLPTVEPSPGVNARVLFGTAFGATSPIVHPSAPVLVELAIAAGSRVALPAGVAELAVFVIAGEVRVGTTTLAHDHLAVVRADRADRGAELEATTAARVMMLGGPPLGARLIEWNFVASTAAQLERARTAWRAQTFAKIPGDDLEYVPLPEFPHRANDGANDLTHDRKDPA